MSMPDFSKRRSSRSSPISAPSNTIAYPSFSPPFSSPTTSYSPTASSLFPNPTRRRQEVPSPSVPIAVPKPRQRTSSSSYSSNSPLAYSGMPSSSFWPETAPRLGYASDYPSTSSSTLDDDPLFQMDDMTRPPSPYGSRVPSPQSRNSYLSPTAPFGSSPLSSVPSAMGSPALTFGSSSTSSSSRSSPISFGSPSMEPLSVLDALGSALPAISQPPLFSSKPNQYPTASSFDSPSFQRRGSEPLQTHKARPGPMAPFDMSPALQPIKFKQRRASFQIGSDDGYESSASDTPRASYNGQHFNFS